MHFYSSLYVVCSYETIHELFQVYRAWYVKMSGATVVLLFRIELFVEYVFIT